MRECQRCGREMFVLLAHPPGHAQSDFGKATMIIGGVERKAHFFVMDLAHSDACFVRAYPAATAEAWVDGQVRACAFLGKVPLSVLYDKQGLRRDTDIHRPEQFQAGPGHDVAAMDCPSAGRDHRKRSVRRDAATI